MTLFASLFKHVPDIYRVLCFTKTMSFLLDTKGRKK